MIKWLPYLVMAILLSGCASSMDTPPRLRGLLFTYTVTPFTPDLHNTPVTSKTGNGMGIRIKEPFTGYGVSAEVDSNAIGEIARTNGMKEVYFADMEEFNILGIWRERRLHVYGK